MRGVIQYKIREILISHMYLNEFMVDIFFITYKIMNYDEPNYDESIGFDDFRISWKHLKRLAHMIDIPDDTINEVYSSVNFSHKRCFCMVFMRETRD